MIRPARYDSSASCAVASSGDGARTTVSSASRSDASASAAASAERPPGRLVQPTTTRVWIGGATADDDHRAVRMDGKVILHRTERAVARAWTALIDTHDQERMGRADVGENGSDGTVVDLALDVQDRLPLPAGQVSGEHRLVGRISRQARHLTRRLHVHDAQRHPPQGRLVSSPRHSLRSRK